MLRLLKCTQIVCSHFSSLSILLCSSTAKLHMVVDQSPLAPKLGLYIQLNGVDLPNSHMVVDTQNNNAMDHHSHMVVDPKKKNNITW